MALEGPSLSGRAAVVTGGASGIGLATARLLAARGARVVIADLQAEAGEEAAREVGGHFVHTDVTDPASWTALMARIREEHGRLDIVHLNAGVTTGQPDITALTDDQYRATMSVNVDGVVMGARAALPLVEEDGGGALVVTASMAGLIAFGPDPIYTASKHAVVGLVRALADQLAARGVTVNAVCPGIVDTPLVGEARPFLEKAGFPMIPPEEIAEAVLGAVAGGETGRLLVCQAGQPPQHYEFAPVAVPMSGTVAAGGLQALRGRI